MCSTSDTNPLALAGKARHTEVTGDEEWEQTRKIRLSGFNTEAASSPMIVASRTATIEYLSAGTRHVW